MIKNFLKHKYIQELLGWLISFYIKICFNTSLWYVKNDESIKKNLKKKKSILVCFWHNRMLMAPFCWNYQTKFKMLISEHRDGRIISNAVSHLGIDTISGSSNKNKISSAKKIIEELKIFNTVGITPDGPRGPKEKASSGIIKISKATQVPIIALGFDSTSNKKLGSWDSFLLTYPFSKCCYVWSDPILIPNDIKDNEIQKYQNLIESEINKCIEAAKGKLSV